MVDRSRRCASGLGVGWRKGVVRLRLRGRRQWVVDQRMGIAPLHWTLLIGRWFMVGFIILIVEAAIFFYRAAPCLSPTSRRVMTLSGQGGASGGRNLERGRFRREAPLRWGPALGPTRWRRNSFTDHRGVSDMGPGRCRGLRQLSTSSSWCTGPRRGGDWTPAD